MENRLYKEKYGDWAGNTAGHKPDYTLCCEEIADYSTRWPMYHQCRKKRGYGPDQAYCKIHDPAAVAARRQKSDDKYNREWNARRYEIHGKKFFNALQAIADGHNDARGLAQEVIAEFKAGERKVSND